MAGNIRRMQIIFDLDTVKLEEIEKNSSKAIYTKIKKFMDESGYDHIEFSGYVSREPVRLARVLQLIHDLKATFPILNETVNEMHITEVGNTYSVNHLFHVED